MWFENDKGKLEFSGGKEDWVAAAQIAGKCLKFRLDDEDEISAEEAVSCYNCRFRRWTMSSFMCCKSEK